MICQGGDGLCTKSAEADGFCDDHHPLARLVLDGLAPPQLAELPVIRPRSFAPASNRYGRAFNDHGETDKEWDEP